MELFEMTAHQLSGLLRSRELGAVELTKSYLKRIKDIEPIVESYITVLYDEAIKKAEKTERIFSEGGELPLLAGIPMAVKDNICTENILTTCGSKMLECFIPPFNATVVDKLYLQETILLGKLNLDEFAMGSSCGNCFFKRTKNPWNINRVPGGSSGGSAAAVAAGEAAFTVGTDTGGSVRQPASFCGVVGMKPTYGAVSRNGLIAFASSLDQIGPITRDVTDCALVLNAITGHDKNDSTSTMIKHPDYLKSLVDDVKDIRIGIPKEFMDLGLNSEVKEAVLKAAGLFEELGAKIVDCSLPLADHGASVYDIISSAEASSNLARFDGVKYGYRAKSSENIDDMYINSRSEGFGLEVKKRILMGTYWLTSENYEAYYRKALKVRRLIAEDFEKVFEICDVILGPTAPTTAYTVTESGNDINGSTIGDKYTSLVNIAGLPAISVPCGFDRKGMPIGFQLIGKQFCEGTLIRSAYTFEQNTLFHLKRPRIKSANEINQGEYKDV